MNSKQKNNKNGIDIVGTVQKNLLRATSALTLAGALTMTSSAYAAVGNNETPTGFSLQAGTVAAPVLSGPSNRNMSLTQSTSRAVINWTTFNIGKDASVNFNQTQGKNSIAVNRVTGPQNDPSQILGKLNANGRVMILDRNGVLFGSQSKVDVGGLIASTGDLADQAAFMAGADQFVIHDVNNKPGSKIDNKGQISIKDGGLMAFVAPYVENSGTITAKVGKVSLASSTKVTVDLTGDSLISFAPGDALQSSPVLQALIKNSGSIAAEGGVVNLSANVAKDVVDEAINMSGIIKANSFQTNNGRIILSGGGGKTKVSGTIEANRDTTSGDANSAGSVSISGDSVEITDTARISAYISGVMGGFLNLFNQGGTGDGGNVYVWGENSVVFAGKIDVRGGTLGGNGGDVEISGNDALAYRGTVDASARHSSGLRGMLTIDPAVVTIGNSMFDPVVNAGMLAETLGLTNVHIIASDKIVLVDKADLSHWGFGGLSVTKGDLELTAPTIDLLKDVKMGAGDLTVDADTINLGGKLYRNTVPVVNLDLFNTLLGRDDLDGYASVVNVLGDTALIQQGIHLAQSGGTVNVAWGNYQENINIYKSVALRGDGSMPILFGTNPLGEVILVTANDVTVDGFSIDGVHAPWFLPHLYGIKAEGVSGLTVSNNSFGDFIGAGVKLTDTNGSTVDNNSFNLMGTAIDLSGGGGHVVSNNDISTTGTAIKLAGVVFTQVFGNSISGSIVNAIEAAGFDFSKITDNFIFGAGSNGIVVDGGQEVEISGNTVGGVLTGDSINVGNVSGLKVKGNIAGLSGDDAIDLHDVSDVDVSFNAAGLSGDNALEMTGVSDAEVYLNALGATTGGDAVHVSGGHDLNILANLTGLTGDDGIEINGADGVNVAANIIAGAGDNGVEIINASSVNVMANVITGAGNNGVFVDPSTGIVAANVITGSANNGIEVLDSDGFHVLANFVSNSGNNGILVSNSDGVSVGANTVSGSGNDGIHVEDSFANFILGNKVSDSTGDGIDVERAAGTIVSLNSVEGSGANGIEVSESLGAAIGLNKISGSGIDGIRVANAALSYIGHNRISDSGQDGIGLYTSAGTWIDDNKVGESGDDGIDVHYSLGALVTGNNVSGAEDDGIDVDSGALVRISGNDVTKIGDNGIEISDSALALVKGNTVSFTGDDGIEVSDSSGVGIRGNKVSRADGDGIDVDGSNHADIDGNEVKRVDGNGIEVTDSGHVEIDDNDVSRSGDNGIYASNVVDLEIDDNNVRHSGNDGIHVEGSDGVDVTENTVTDSGDDGIDVSGDGEMYYPSGLVSEGDDGDDDYGHHHVRRGVRILDNDVEESGDNGIEAMDLRRVRISRNDVEDSYNNGIFVSNVDQVRIRRNSVDESGHEGWDDEYWWHERVGDGIHVEGGRRVDVIGNDVDDSADDGIDVSGSDYDVVSSLVSNDEGDGYQRHFRRGVRIIGNDVEDSGDNGIEVTSLDRALIADNDVEDSGNNGIFVAGLGNVDIFDNDVEGGNNAGIMVLETMFSDIDGNDVSEFYNGIEVHYAFGSRINGNDVSGVWNDGIQVSNVGGFAPALISEEGEGQEEEEISYDLEITNNTVSHYFDDGIQVSRSGTVLIGNNTIDGAFGDDDEGSEVQGISFKDDYLAQTTGIRLGDNEGCRGEGRCSDNFRIADVSFPYGFGDFSGNFHVDVIGNTVSNNAVGLHAMAFNNGYIGLFGNQFTDNTIGSWIGSGLIDLTGESNTFTGGDVAMRFERASYDVYGYPEYEIAFDSYEGDFYEDEGPSFETVFADLNLVGDTIGTTIFEGQEQYYIELLNGAFFDPGKPTIIEGRYASFDGFIPGEDPIDPLVLKAIEDMINDYDDDTTLGQIFVGTPFNPFDDNDIMRRIFGNSFKPGRSGIFITGLPTTGGNGGQGGNAGFLAGLEPAAGGEGGNGGQGGNAGFFAGLEPAAGGEGGNGGNVVDGKCWGNAASMAGQAIVSLDMSEELSDILADQSECGSDL